MASHFSLSFRFLDPAFHGRRDGGVPEWPPSPMRALQSLVAAAARSGTQALPPNLELALRWLEKQPAPTVIAPDGITASGYRLSVPNNAMDIVAKAWCRGNDSNSGDANPATHRAMKTVRPTLLLGSDAVHYLWPVAGPLSEEVRGHIESLIAIARSVVALGWGIDLVVAAGAMLSDRQADALPGDRWLPSLAAADDGLRVPRDGSVDDLIHRHTRFLKRLGPDGFTAPPPISAYRTMEYRRASDPPFHSVAAFSLLRPDTGGFHPFDAARRTATLACMVREAASRAAKRGDWPQARIDSLILGRVESSGATEHVPVGPRRFAYLPLPSIEVRGEGKNRVVGDIRRLMVTSFAEDFDAEIEWARRALSGQELIDEAAEQQIALLSLLPKGDKMLWRYTQPAAAWATVTPVVLPGYDDPDHYRRGLKHGVGAATQRKLLERLDARIDGLLRKAITQAGFLQLLADTAELNWRGVGFWPGTELAARYAVPDHLKRFPRLHVRLQWRDARERPVQVPGPVCLGGGRFYGLGLFAACEPGSTEWSS